jgi:hypothetical protein
MSNLTDWIKNELYPTLFQSIDTALPEFNFKKRGKNWISSNKLKITGKTPYAISLHVDPLDSTKYIATILPGLTSLNLEQNIDITTGIYRDPKSKRMMTRVTTDYPGLTFNDINSFDITDNPDTRKALKAARKEFGLGVQVGYGISGSSAGLSPGFYIGFGVHYSPRFLQFGK